MFAVFVIFAMFCAFVAYAPEELTQALLAGVWVLMLLGTVAAAAGAAFGWF